MAIERRLTPVLVSAAAIDALRYVLAPRPAHAGFVLAAHDREELELIIHQFKEAERG